MPQAKNLAVVEARWESSGNYGVRPLFEMISALTTTPPNPHAIRQDMFQESQSLEFVLRDLVKGNDVDAVYVASHGERDSINGVPRDELVAILRRANARGRVAGLFIAACSFLRSTNIAALLNPNNLTGLQWVAGYQKEVDWLESAAADILFWSGYLHSDGKRALTKAKHGAGNLFCHMPLADSQLGFGIFKWSTCRAGVVDLVDE